MDGLGGGLHGAHLRSDAVVQLGPRGLRGALAAGLLRTSWPRVVVEGARANDLRTRGAAAFLAFGPRCALTGPTAAELHGCTAVATPRTHLLVPYGRNPRSRLGLVVQHGPSMDDDVEMIDGLPVVALDRVVAGLLCRASPRDALAACDQALALQADTDRDAWRLRVGRRIAARPDPRGTRRGRELLALATGRAASPAESWLLLMVVEFGLPWPEVNWPLMSPWGRRVCLLDLAWPDLRIAVEYQGYAVHAGREEHDEARFADLRRRGWIVVEADRADFDDPQRLQYRLADAFRRRRYTWAA